MTHTLTSPAAKTALSPVLAAIFDQAHSNSTGLDPCFRDEFRDRLSMVIDATDLLQAVLENAVFHDFELSHQHLFGAVKLIARELKVVDELLDALATTIQAVPDFHKALPHY